ncbi:DUF3408 domain-containing protein [Bacteroidales bacterium OttesenSCG-928-J19]|nr:DUF3408 domain-containing protein [Bacteroidales bacterium OttesenSCG-928-J19]
MIYNPIIYSENAIMIGFVACCLIVLAIIMIPKVIKHRKQVRENKCEETVQEKELEVQMIVVPNEDFVSEQSITNYKRRFLVNADIPTRNGKQVGIRKKYHSRISKIVQVVGKNEVTIFSYIDNVLKHHFEAFQDDISGLYKKNYNDDFLSPKK